MRFTTRLAVCLRVLPAVLLLVGAACATGGAPKSSSGPRRSFSVISREELAEQRWTSVHHAVSVLRPQWLQPRSPDSIHGRPLPMQVYLDRTRLSGLDELRHIRTDGVARVEYVGPTEASSRWGIDHGQGAIVLHTER